MFEFKLFTSKLYKTVHVSQWIIDFLNIYVIWREYKFTRNIKEVPQAMKKYLTKANFDIIKLTRESKLFFEIISNLLIFLVQIAWSDELSHISIWNYSKRLSGSQSESIVTVVFIGLITCKDFLFALPMWIYAVVQLTEESWLNTIELMFAQLCIEIGSQCVLLSVLLYLYNSLPNLSKKKMSFSAAGALFAILCYQQIALKYIFGGYLMPLEEPAINKELEPFLKKMNFPQGQIFLLKMDSQTDMPNAFTLGSKLMNNEMIVITDNVIGMNKDLNNCCTHKEVVSIILHELGHVYYNHVLKTECLDFIMALSSFILFIHLNQATVFISYGFLSQVPTIANILIRLDIMAPYVTLCTLFYMVLARSFEYRADFFSSTFSKEAFKSALLKLHMLHSDDLQTHDTLYSVWYFDHPSLLERLDNIDRAS